MPNEALSQRGWDLLRAVDLHPGGMRVSGRLQAFEELAAREGPFAGHPIAPLTPRS